MLKPEFTNSEIVSIDGFEEDVNASSIYSKPEIGIDDYVFEQQPSIFELAHSKQRIFRELRLNFSVTVSKMYILEDALKNFNLRHIFMLNPAAITFVVFKKNPSQNDIQVNLDDLSGFLKKYFDADQIIEFIKQLERIQKFITINKFEDTVDISTVIDRFKNLLEFNEKMLDSKNNENTNVMQIVGSPSELEASTTVKITNELNASENAQSGMTPENNDVSNNNSSFSETIATAHIVELENSSHQINTTLEKVRKRVEQIANHLHPKPIASEVPAELMKQFIDANITTVNDVNDDKTRVLHHYESQVQIKQSTIQLARGGYGGCG